MKDVKKQVKWDDTKTKIHVYETETKTDDYQDNNSKPILYALDGLPKKQQKNYIQKLKPINEDKYYSRSKWTMVNL